MPSKKKFPKEVIEVGDGDARIVTPTDPLDINATNFTMDWIKIQGGQIRVLVASTATVRKLEKLS